MNANLFTKKIEMTKAEAKAAGKIGTQEFKDLREYMAAYPGYEIEIKAPAKRKNEFRGLDYDYMRNYIQKHDDENGTIMDEFNDLIAQDKDEGKEGFERAKAANYAQVKKWFLKKFPAIKQYKEDHQKKVQEILAA